MDSRWYSPILLMGWLILSACDPEAFPDCCVGTDDRRDAPFTTTYLFQFKTGTRDIEAPNPNRLLRIITEADIMTLKNAASTSQRFGQGLIGGLVQGFDGPVREVAIQVTDRDGNIVGFTEGADWNLFYNSLGRVPDFLINQGTGAEGTFTLFNAPPGELFFQAVRGGRGNGRITSFPNAVSKGRIDILPVFPDTIGILGVVTDASGIGNTPDAAVTFSGRRDGATGNADGLFILSQDQGLPTQGEFLIRLTSPHPDFRETVHGFDTDMERVLERQQAFDPLTIDGLTLFSEEHLQNMAASAGVSLAPSWGIVTGRIETEDGTGQSGAVVIPLDENGKALDLKNGGRRLFYFDGTGNIDPNLAATTDQSRFMLFLDSCASTPAIFLHSYALTETVPPGLVTGRASTNCEPGRVFVRDIVIKSMPKEGLPSDPPWVTVEIKGDVEDEDGATVGGAKIQILGSNVAPLTAAGDGSYTVSPGPAGAVSPVLANGDYTIRTALDGNYIPTYQTFAAGPSGGRRDLRLLQSSMQGTLCPSGTLHILGTARDIGLLDPLRKGRAEEGISLKVFKEDGTEAGQVVYPDAVSATSRSGRFAVCDLPAPDRYQIRVTSPDDSGSLPVQSRADGVVIVSMAVNKALPEAVRLSGGVLSCSGPETGSVLPVGNMDIRVLGTQKTADNGRLRPLHSLPGKQQPIHRPGGKRRLPPFLQLPDRESGADRRCPPPALDDPFTRGSGRPGAAGRCDAIP